MTDIPQLSYDPRMKREIRDHLYQYLYSAVERKFNARLKEIVIQNSRLKQSSADAFVYNNETFTAEPNTVRIRNVPLLDPRLHSVMDDFLAEREELNAREMPFVLGFINETLNASDDLQDYMRIFPENLHPPLKEIVNKCLCRQARLSEERVKEIQERNARPMELMRQRLVYNIIMK